ncbi:hypothetical protein RchiOBHm_Chr7g0212041 [Rosa chinensis]|uniref:Uncharacterized protein n=1 Tax=Rosa chinensis TaxID=74649 RepID=A0A2P6PAL3_ROSCH|nr:hypothetical protein RchiOBHm_Chr7g0212041 [Rosa chinensis]
MHKNDWQKFLFTPISTWEIEKKDATTKSGPTSAIPFSSGGVLTSPRRRRMMSVAIWLHHFRIGGRWRTGLRFERGQWLGGLEAVDSHLFWLWIYLFFCRLLSFVLGWATVVATEVKWRLWRRRFRCISGSWL